MPITVSRPRSPTVAEELAEVSADVDILLTAANRRATVASGFPGGLRFTFEDGSCIEFNTAEQSALIKPNCQE